MITISLLFLIAIKAYNNITKKVSFLNISPVDLFFKKDKSLHMSNQHIEGGNLNSEIFSTSYNNNSNRVEADNFVSLQIVDSYLISRIVAIVFAYSGLININFLYIQEIGSGMGLFSGLFYINQTSMYLETFIFIIGSLILLSIRPNKYSNFISSIYNININSNFWNRPGMVFDFKNLHWKKNNISFFYEMNLLQTKTLELVRIKLNNFLLGLLPGNHTIKNSLVNSINSNNLELDLKMDNKNNYWFTGNDSEVKTDYSLIVLFSALGSSLLISSGDLISMYLSIELQSFGLYVLATLYKNSESSTSAGLKYFLLGGLSSSIILLGSGIVYSYTGLTDLELIGSLNNILVNNMYTINTNELNNSLSIINNTESYGLELSGVNLGFILIFVGLLFKISAAPLHNWSPDVYDQTPTIVTIWLTIIPKLSIVILLLELCFQFYSNAIFMSAISYLDYFYLENIFSWNNSLKILLLIASMLSLIVGTVVGLAQIKLKRLLAYSTISHVGFILLALSIKSSHSIDSLLFYIIQYTITNLGIFLIIINFMDVKFIKDMKGMLYENTFVSFSLIISFFSLAGIPPLLGFFAKQYTLLAAVQSNYYLISIIAIITSVISASYYLKLINMIMTEKNTSYDNITTLTNITNIFKKSNNNSNNNISNNNKRNINSITIVEKKLLFLFNDNNFENKVLPSLVSASSPICNIIAIITLAMTLFIFKPSIMLSSTGVLSLQLWGIYT